MEIVVSIKESRLEVGIIEEIGYMVVNCVSFWVEVLEEDGGSQRFRRLVVSDGLKDGLKSIWGELNTISLFYGFFQSL